MNKETLGIFGYIQKRSDGFQVQSLSLGIITTFDYFFSVVGVQGPPT